jgi:hypothetical protein
MMNNQENDKDFIHFDEVHLNFIQSNECFQDIGAEVSNLNDQMFENDSYRSIGTTYRSVETLTSTFPAMLSPSSFNEDQSKASMSSSAGFQDASYRSVSSVNRSEGVATSSFPFAGKNKSFLTVQPAPFTKNSESQQTPLSTSSTSQDITEESIFVPPEPFYVSPVMHFTTESSIVDVKNNIESVLTDRTGLSFEYFPTKCRWVVFFLLGSQCTKFEICVYKCTNGSYMIEGNRLSGDSMPFVETYQAIRKLFIDEVEEYPAIVLANPSPLEPSPDEVEKSIDNILSMADSGVGEAQLGASQIFCDIFSQSDALPHIEKMSECLIALTKLAQVDFQFCNQHAICALAELSSTRACQDILSRDDNFLKSLLSLCTDGTYDTIQMRRECARLLANITSSGGNSGASQVVNSAGLESVATWMRSVDDLKDERLRLHADRARDSLSTCISISS